MSRMLFAAKTDLDGITHEQTITCRQLIAGHVVGSQPMKIGEKIHGMIMRDIGLPFLRTFSSLPLVSNKVVTRRLPRTGQDAG